MQTKTIVQDALLGLAIGDAVGVPVEFIPRSDLKMQPVTDMLGYGTHNQPTAGRKTTTDSLPGQTCFIVDDIWDSELFIINTLTYASKNQDAPYEISSYSLSLTGPYNPDPYSYYPV